MIGTNLIAAGTGCTPAAAVKYQAALSAAADKFQINTARRLAAWLANVGHESGGLVYAAEIWGPTALQQHYDARVDLGNTRPEAVRIARFHGSTPGRWWRGHGWIQTTGYDNHLAAGQALGLDLLNHPELLSIPEHAAMSAAQFFSTHGCNTLADAGDFDGVCDEINRGHKTAPVGDAIGYADRAMLYRRALAVPIAHVA
ncbi:glycoside hydrolase family 19 protein [Paludibacterium yongneupense]|uniref:glycoside hydrolase family 19 protein n=1 Tax=Paludibacterium yongneupense TaxID=400061 RepID=UPI00055BFAD8|nr:glycoside hydrolase family 19 protein [Paludibacterium yongneupense]